MCLCTLCQIHALAMRIAVLQIMAVAMSAVVTSGLCSYVVVDIPSS